MIEASLYKFFFCSKICREKLNSNFSLNLWLFCYGGVASKKKEIIFQGCKNFSLHFSSHLVTVLFYSVSFWDQLVSRNLISIFIAFY